MARSLRLSTACLAAALASLAGGVSAQVRILELSGTKPDRISIYTVRGEGVTTPLISFQERARREVEAHMHAEIVSMDETLARGGPELQRRLAACQGEPKCFAGLLSAVDARYLLLITASLLGDMRLVGARLLDLEALTIVGEAIDTIPDDQAFLTAIPERIRASVPAERWDPFGSLDVETSQPGARVTVNGRTVGLGPALSLSHLLPGSYAVAASKEGFEPAALDVEVARGGAARASLRLDPIAAPESGGGWWWWVALGAAAIGGAVAAGVVLGSGGETSFCSGPTAESCR